MKQHDRVCFIMGKPDNDVIRDLQRPIAVQDLPKIFGFV